MRTRDRWRRRFRANCAAKQVEVLYNKHVRLAKKSDPVNKSFVDMAVTIHERVLSLPEVAEVVRDIRNFLGSDSPLLKNH